VLTEASGKSMRLAWDSRHPARTWNRKQRNAHRWKPLQSYVTEYSSLCVRVICKV
jgi:hypothetical protein